MRRHVQRYCVVLGVLVGVAFGGIEAVGAQERLAIPFSPANANYWDLHVAFDKGFFKDEGFAPQTIASLGSTQTIQLMLSGSAELTVSQPEAVFSALLRGGKGFGIIAAPVNRKDWFLMGRPEIKSLSDLKGKTLGFGGLRVGEHWYTVDYLAQHGVQASEYNSIVVGTSEPRFAALQNGSIAATTLYQPTAQLAIKVGMKVLYQFKDSPVRAPAIVYVVSRKFAAEKDHGKRIARALVRSHEWLRDPANRSEAISIVSKYTRVAPDLLDPVYELYLGPDGIMTPDGAVELEGLRNTLAVMAKHKAIPAGASVEAEQYLIPKDLGGLYR